MKIRAAILKEHNSPFVVEDIELEDPGPGEVLIKVVSSSLCHTDIAAIEGHYESLPLPAVLGHEAAGIVEKIGEGVTKVKQGDHIITTAIVHCNCCRNCYTGRYYSCEKFNEIAFQGNLPAGGKRLIKKERISHFFAQSSFATYAVIPETIAIPIPSDAPLRHLSPLSCGVQTGSGAVMNSGMELGSTFAIFGCGGVGLSAVMGARAIGASEIIAVDINEDRLALAYELGATYTINAKKDSDLTNEIKRVTEGGADCAIECVGKKETIMDAIACTREFGTTILVGIAPRGTLVNLDFFSLLHKNIRGCIGGYANSEIFIPYLVKLYVQGRLPFDKLSPKYYTLDRINDAVEDMISGRVVKPLLKLD